MTRPSLRWLLLGSVLLAFLVGFGAFAFYIDHEQRESRLSDVDDELMRASRALPVGGPVPGPPPHPDEPPLDEPLLAGDAGELIAGGERPEGRPEPPRPEPAGESLAAEVEGAEDGAAVAPVQVLLASDGRILRSIGASVPFDQATLQALLQQTGFSTSDDPRHRVLVNDADGEVFGMTALPLAQYDEAVADLRQALAFGGGVVLALVAAVLWWLTGFLARPVTRMADSASRIAAGDLSATIAEPSGARETFELSMDLQQMVSRLQNALNDSTQSRDAMERLLADMAHEIRTPLTALKGYSDLYEQGMLDGEGDVDRAMGRIGSESIRLHRLAEDMLQLAREGLAENERTHVSLASVAHAVVSDVGAAYPDQTLVVHADEGPHLVLGSESKLHQAVLNLAANACHHNPSPTPIIVSVTSTPTEVALSVADHGPGVAPEEKEKIFLPFFRSDGSRNHHTNGGAGLGLALARRIAESHTGKLTVSDTPGGGATFLLTMPTPAEPV